MKMILQALIAKSTSWDENNRFIHKFGLTEMWKMVSRYYDFFDLGEEKYLQNISTAGKITSYISMIFNFFVFVKLYSRLQQY